MAVTTLSDLVNPQVMADSIDAELTSMIKFSPFVEIDNTLVARPGNTITVPTFAYVGDAIDVAEGVDIVPADMSASTTTETVKKAGKGIELTDEAILSGYGDPIGQAEKQLGMSIAGKVDSDIYTEAITATLSLNHSSATIDYDSIVDAVAKFEEEEDEVKYLFLHPLQVAQLRKLDDFTPASQLGDDVKKSGVIGEIAGCFIVKTKKIDLTTDVYTNVILKMGALKIYKKRNVEMESDRDILGKKTVITIDQHYVVALSDATKAVKFTNKAT